jgi:hypothetical protein
VNVVQLLFDAGAKRASYRRMAVFAAATWLLLEGHVHETTWCLISLGIIATEGAQRILAEIRPLLVSPAAPPAPAHAPEVPHVP